MAGGFWIAAALTAGLTGTAGEPSGDLRGLSGARAEVPVTGPVAASVAASVAAPAAAGRRAPARVLRDPSFERPGRNAWRGLGRVRPVGEAYTGRRGLFLDGSAEVPAGAFQTDLQWAQGEAGDEVSLGFWARPERSGVTLRVEWRGGGVHVSGSGTAEPGAWRWLSFDGAPAESFAAGALDSAWIVADGPVVIDDVQIGAPAAVTGGPERHAACSFVGWYRSPLFGGGGTSPTDPAEIWRNWHWTQPPACGPSVTAFAHDPECSSSAACFRPNGRRNVAVGTTDGDDQLPLFGAYDSRDPNLLEVQVKLAEVIGFDSFVYTYHGDTLAQQLVAQGREPLIRDTFEALLDVCDAPGRKLKLAVMYEPKVHFNGWVTGEPSKAAKLAGIEHDLVHLVTTYGDRKSVLRHDGDLVVYVFRNDVCDPSGTQCLTDADWLAIEQGVQQATGEALFLVADVPTGTASPFRGLLRWHIAALEILRYKTFAAALAGVPSTPAPQPQHLAALADAINFEATNWAAGGAGRLSVAMAWPGFDDTGVAGWSSGNFNGSNGQPVCVRVADDLGGTFFDTTLSSALGSGADWLHVATWNDWNERTGIEPRWHPGYAQAAAAGTLPKRKDFEAAFARAIEAQAAVASFKGLPYGKGKATKLHRKASKYLFAAATDPVVVEYD